MATSAKTLTTSPEPSSPAPDPVPEPESAADDPPLMKLMGLPEGATDDEMQDVVNEQIQWALAKSALGTYNVIFLFDRRIIDRGDANRIYRALSKAARAKPTLLIIESLGGDIPAAYFIAKLCREYTTAEFHVAVPRQAKSAATLICCGADHVHLGSLSELGPIDPQFGSTPALSLKQSIEHLAQLVEAHPAASRMFSDYLIKSLPIEALGYYERVAESATHYALRLLESRSSVTRSKQELEELAKTLVYAYKDHAFAIDAREVSTLLGKEVVHISSPEYLAANDLFIELDFASFVLQRQFGRRLAFTGDAAGGALVYKPSTTDAA